MEDSSILDNKVPVHNPKPQEVVLVSSKQVPIDKLDLDKVIEIQKLQAQGALPPLEESKIIDKKQMREDVKQMIIHDEDESDSSMLDIQHRQQRQMLEQMQGQNGEYEDYDSEDDLNNYGLEDYDKEPDEIYITQNPSKGNVNNDSESNQNPKIGVPKNRMGLYDDEDYNEDDDS